MSLPENPHPNHVRRLWKLAQDIAALDPVSYSGDPTIDLLIRQARDILEDRRHRPGNRFNIEKARQIAAERRVREAQEFRAVMLPVIKNIRSTGVKDFDEIAATLNEMGLKPQRSEAWSGDRVRRFIRSCET